MELVDLSAVCSWMGVPKCLLNPALNTASAIATLSFPTILKGCSLDGTDPCWRGLLPFHKLSLEAAIDHLHANPAIAQNNHQGNLLRFLVYALCHFRALTELQKPPYTSVDNPVHLVILAWKYAKFVLFNDALDMLSYRRDSQYKAIKRQEELGQRAGWTTIDVPFAKFNRRLIWVTPTQLQHWAAGCVSNCNHHNKTEHLQHFVSCWHKVFDSAPLPQMKKCSNRGGVFVAKRRLRSRRDDDDALAAKELEMQMQTTVRLAEIAAAAAMFKIQTEAETERQRIHADLEKVRLTKALSV